MPRLKDKVAIVAGAGSIAEGFSNGKATAVLFAREGAKVFAVDRDLKAASETCEIIKHEGGEATPHQCDVSIAHEVDAMVAACIGKYGRVDVLFNNVGMQVVGGPLEVKEEDWDKLMTVNVKSMYLACRAVIPHMIRQGGGSIINNSSTAGIRFTYANVAYAASKGAVKQLSQNIGVQYAAKGIRCNAVMPGYIATPRITDRLRKSNPQDYDEKIRERQMAVPSGKLGKAWDVAYGVLYLASDECAVRQRDRARDRRRADGVGHGQGVGMSETIAFIGCGAMGAPIAERLIDAGYTVRLFDPRAEAMAPLVARGGVAAKSPRDAATGAEVAFACLPSPEVSRAVAFGADGVAGAASLRTYVEMSTIGSAAIKEIAAELAREEYRDARLSGERRPRGARAGTLSTMVAGEHAAFERVKPMFEALARHVFYVGDTPGMGQVVKLANNMISAAGMLAAFEASAMAVKAGVDARTLIETVNASTGRNSATMDKFPASVLTRSFDYGGKVSTMYKDVHLCLEEAKALKVPMWLGANVVEMWHMGMAEGRGDDDFTSLIKMIEKWAGVVVGGNAAPKE